MDEISTRALFSLIICVFCLSNAIVENATVVPVEVLWYSIPAAKSVSKENLFFPKEIMDRAVKT